MAKIYVTYFDTEGAEQEVLVRADDEAAAVGVVLDMVDDIMAGSPFAVWRERLPRSTTAKRGKGDGGDIISKPKATGQTLDDMADELPNAPTDLQQLDGDSVDGEVIPLPLDMPAPKDAAGVIQLFEQLKGSLEQDEVRP